MFLAASNALSRIKVSSNDTKLILFVYIFAILILKPKEDKVDIKILDFQNSGSLSVLQFETAGKDSFDYVTFSKALLSKEIEVSEVSESGSVNNLFIINHSKNYVFFMDGDILTGAKQNRVLNTSVLLYPESKTNVPVSCVESGRWRYTSPKFTDSDYTAPAYMRRTKAASVTENLSASGVFASDQGKVWDDVEKAMAFSKVDSASRNLSDVVYKRRKDFESRTADFLCNDNTNGFVLFSKNRILSLDVFNRTDVFKEYFPKILKGAVMELNSDAKSCETFNREQASDTLNVLLENIKQMKHDLHKSVGAGNEKRFGDQRFTGFELDYEDKMIHMTALPVNMEF